MYSMLFTVRFWLSEISNVYTKGVAWGRFSYIMSSLGNLEIILTRPLAEPPWAETKMFLPDASFCLISLSHKGRSLLIRSPWFSELGNYLGSTFAYLGSLEGCLSSRMSTGGGAMSKLRLQSATFSEPYFYAI